VNEQTALLPLGRPDDVTGAFFNTFAAIDTFSVIDLRQKVIDGDRACLADLMTHGAADTTDLALLCDGASLFLGHTPDPVGAVVRDQTDQFFRANGNAGAAALTFAVIDRRNAVFYVNGVKRTRRHASAKPDAAIGTELVTARKTRRGKAIRSALIRVLFRCVGITARAHDLCAHTLLFFHRNTHNATDLLRDGISAHGASTAGRFPLDNGGG
jgi:hypothetical protein